ncbi:CRISPR-associated endonuclease Cas2 [Pelagibius litoralis]|uniref:CRISPR-associated endoribonuclease Cas2 n=1 Tax=Pelagibius litoralis TaxID=374515 RepID=A0A967C4X0_9PROT|nr:CRISPR-associated endonuclease Cas2 [Pelagibius litoralis]NIA68490.1 CRISPR-associated endonuclease Cas2 [Pelagibius litoralis]
MWIMVMFDLPVDTKERGKAAAKFREFLLDQGFEMSQFSIYLRFCSGREQFEAFSRRIERNLPEFGKVHILAFTDKQYENIVRFNGRTRAATRKNPGQLALF